MGETIPKTNLWDTFVLFLANQVLHLASKQYQETLQGVLDYGMNAAARDTFENREPPEHWSVYAAKAKKIREGHE